MRENKPFRKRRISSKEKLDQIIKEHSERNSKNKFDDIFGLTRNSEVMSNFFLDRQDLDMYAENIK